MKSVKILSCFALIVAFNLTTVSLYGCTPDSPVLDNTKQPSTPEDKNDPEEPSIPSEPEKPEPPEIPSDGILRILAIGNSFSQDAVEQYLYELFEAAGQKVIIGNLYIGGCSLERHWGNTSNGKADYYYRKIVNGVKTETKNATIFHGLTDEPWDIISLQQASGVSGKYEAYTPYLPNLISWLRQNAPKKDFRLAWHQTWAYASSSDHSAFSNYGKDQMTMYRSIVECTKNALRDNHFDILIPSGTAVQNGRTSLIGDSYNRDGYHLETTYGRYTAACTWFEAITGQSVVGNSYAPATVDELHKNIAQNAAHLAVLEPYSVTEMTDFQKPYTGTPAFTASVQIDFGGGSAVSPGDWNRVAVTTAGKGVFLKGSDLEWSPLVIESLEGFTGTFNGVGAEPEKAVTIDGVDYPKSVWADGLIVAGTKGEGDTEPASVTISGFDPGKSYTVKILAVRFNGSADARISEYSLRGAENHVPKTIYPGMKTYDESADFGKYMVTFGNVKPDADGRIVISVVGKDTGKAADGNINAVIITQE